MRNQHDHNRTSTRLARRKGGIEAVEDPHLVGAVALAVQVQGHPCPVAPAKLAAPDSRGAGTMSATMRLPASNNRRSWSSRMMGFLLLQIWDLSGKG